MLQRSINLIQLSITQMIKPVIPGFNILSLPD